MFLGNNLRASLFHVLCTKNKKHIRRATLKPKIHRVTTNKNLFRGSFDHFTQRKKPHKVGCNHYIYIYIYIYMINQFYEVVSISTIINYLIIFYQPCVTPTTNPQLYLRSIPIPAASADPHPRQMRWISSAAQSSSSARTAWLGIQEKPSEYEGFKEPK